ncbi:MAG: DUF1822 family protein [Rhizonema sp. PD37]|nr:DUF1822 family protein [Rhizonema sp. PD37]
MIDQSPPISDTDLLDWQCINETRILLLPQHFQTAARLSQLIHYPQQRWQVYLCALAVLGFEQWLKERAPDLNIQTNTASIWQPAYANLLTAVCNITVGDFKLCLAIASNLTNQHSLPFAIFDIPNLTAHFYLLMRVEEEEAQVVVCGFMNFTEYLQKQAAQQLQVESDWTYTLPEAWFNSDPDQLLLNLRCLDVNAIQLPATAPVQTDVTVLRQKLMMLKSQQPWECLTVKEGITLLSHPDLVNIAYNIATPALAQPLINVSLWIRNQIDTLAQELGWMLMPSPTLSPLRGLRGNFEDIRAGLEAQGVEIPVIAQSAYCDLKYKQGGLRLYVMTWVLSEMPHPEWTLLISLALQPHVQMPKTLKLEVRDETQLLFNQSLQDTNQGILYAQVIGNWDERFWVTITADDEAVFEIPPFGMELE